MKRRPVVYAASGLVAVFALMVIVGGAWLSAAERNGDIGETTADDNPADNNPVDDDAVAAFMRAKLASSQKVLEGLVTKDFNLIQSGADEMHHMSEAAEWRSIHDPVYEHYSSEFRRLTEKLSRLAEDRNSEGAAFTYLHTTTTCISCHEYVRDVIHIAEDNGPDAVPPQVDRPRDVRQPRRR